MADLPARARVVIVGGGVIGCSIAYHLSALGVTDVVLIERHELTAGTTWHAAGLITSAGMVDETSLWMARYSRDLYSRLEAETGHSTGFREIGHLHLATTPERLETLRRERGFQRGFGVDNVEISAAEVAELSPVTAVDDILAASYVADEGRADPVGVATALSKGATARGVTIVKGVSVTGLRTDNGRVTAVTTDAGDVECETVVHRRRPVVARARAAAAASTSRCRLPSTTTCSPSRSRASTATCRSSRTRTATPTTARRAAACSSGSSSRSARRGSSTGRRPTSPSAPCRPTGTG